MIDDLFTASSQGRETTSRRCSHPSAALEAHGDSGSTSRALRWARAGDRQALRFLYVRYADDVYGYVRGIVGDDYEAEDVTRQVFARMTDSIDRYEERDVSFHAWMLSISRDLTQDHVRRRPQPHPQSLTSRVVTV